MFIKGFELAQKRGKTTGIAYRERYSQGAPGQTEVLSLSAASMTVNAIIDIEHTISLPAVGSARKAGFKIGFCFLERQVQHASDRQTKSW